MRAPGRTDRPDTWAMLPGASPVCGAPCPHPCTMPPPFHSLAPFSTVLPGFCLACDNRAILQCLEHHYAAFPLPNGTSFYGFRTLQEDVADMGGLAIALKVTHIPKARISYQQNRQPVLFFLSYPPG